MPQRATRRASPVTLPVTSAAVPVESCWRIIGVAGDRSCGELPKVVHCRSCPVLSRAADHFLERAAPRGYAEGFTGLVAQAQAPRAVTESALLFRLGKECLAIETRAVVEIAPFGAMHRIAHRTDTLVAGMVNIRGQLHLAFSLQRLLQLPPLALPATAQARRRLVVVADGAYTWVFGVDEVLGVEAVDPTQLAAAPSTLPAPLADVTRGVFPCADQRAVFLNAARLFSALRRVAG